MPKSPVVRRFDDDESAVSTYEDVASDGYGRSLQLPSSRQTAHIADGELSTRGYHFTKTRLVMPPLITQDEWEDIGALIVTAHGSAQWWIGDWLHRADKEWGDRSIEMALAVTPYKKDTLYNLASIAKAVHFSLRNENLTFSHHVAVAKLSPVDQERWLKWSDKGGKTVRELRHAIKDEKTTDAQRERKARSVERKRYVNYFANVAKLATSSKEITADDYAAIETSVAEMLAALKARVK
jgi:hypothetical protein